MNTRLRPQMRAGEDSVVSGSYDATIRLWCLKTGNCRKVLRGHGDRVLCLFWDGDCLLSGSTDQTIKVWSVELGTCTGTLSGHRDAVTCLSMSEGRKVNK